MLERLRAWTKHRKGPRTLTRDPEEESNLPMATQHADSIYWTRSHLLPLAAALSIAGWPVFSLLLS